ncbi:MAG: metallophosphoesterase family protein [Pyrobaculum sp.]
MSVRILHISDVHCDSKRLAKVLNSERYDLVLATGDFECIETVDILAGVKAFAVTGNMDDIEVRRGLEKLGISLDGRVTAFGDITIGGLGGLDPVDDVERLKETLGSFGKLDVLISHHPPVGVLDEPQPGLHIGLREVRELVEGVRPRLHLFGHVHETPGHVVRGGTIHVNAGPLKRGYYALVHYSKDIIVQIKKL